MVKHRRFSSKFEHKDVLMEYFPPQRFPHYGLMDKSLMGIVKKKKDEGCYFAEITWFLLRGITIYGTLSRHRQIFIIFSYSEKTWLLFHYLVHCITNVLSLHALVWWKFTNTFLFLVTETTPYCNYLHFKRHLFLWFCW